MEGRHLNEVIHVGPPTAPVTLRRPESGSSPRTPRSAFRASMGWPGVALHPPAPSPCKRSHSQPPPSKAFQTLTTGFANMVDVSPSWNTKEWNSLAALSTNDWVREWTTAPGEGALGRFPEGERGGAHGGAHPELEQEPDSGFWNPLP